MWRYHTSGLICISGATAQKSSKTNIVSFHQENHQKRCPGGPAVWNTCPSTKQYGFKSGQRLLLHLSSILSLHSLSCCSYCHVFNLKKGDRRSKIHSWVATVGWMDATNPGSCDFGMDTFLFFAVALDSQNISTFIGYITEEVSFICKSQNQVCLREL